MNLLQGRYDEMKAATMPVGLNYTQVMHWYQNYAVRADNLCADLLADLSRVIAERDAAKVDMARLTETLELAEENGGIIVAQRDNLRIKLAEANESIVKLSEYCAVLVVQNRSYA